MATSKMNCYLSLFDQLSKEINVRESESKFKEIRKLQKDLKTAESTIASSIAHEDVAIFIGTTKSGKSTLINSLIGNQLLGVKDEKLRKVYIRKADHPHQHGPQIGRGPTSETVIPTRWPASSGKLPGLALWDSPGFEDNRSSSQDIINAFYIYQLFKNIRTAKVVLVTDFNDIYNDCINSFLSLLTSVENLFNVKFRHCFSSIVVIFTKVPKVIDDEPVNVDFVTDLVEHKILSETSLDISQSALEFVRYLIKNNEQIGLFRSASVGPITSSSIDAGVVQAIRTAKSIGCRILNGVSPSVSDKSKTFLHEIRLELVSSGPLQKLGSCVSEILNNRLHVFQTEIDSIELNHYSWSKLSCMEDQLVCLNKRIKTLSNADTSFLEIIKVLREIDHLNLDFDDLIERKNMMEFVDSLLELENTHLIMRNFRCNMETVKSNASEVMLNLQMAKNEVEKDRFRRRIERERKERSEERERERRRMERELRKEREEREEEERERRKKESESRKKSEEIGIGAIFVPPGCFDPVPQIPGPLSSLPSLFKKFF